MKIVLYLLFFLPFYISQGYSQASAPPRYISKKLQSIPPRSPKALTGSEFFKKIWDFPHRIRERAIYEEIVSGNIPDFLRKLEPIPLTFNPPNKKTTRATLWTLPNYLAVGSNEDYVFVPMNLFTAVKIAKKFGFSLPTRKIVDEIYRHAQIKLHPRLMPPKRKMTSTEYFSIHNNRIKKQIADRDLSMLMAGHKKDVVITSRNKKNRIAIYGWHRINGRPIQPLSTVHDATYVDYSHGIRLISDIVMIDGNKFSLFDALKDSQLYKIFSDEGRIYNPLSL